MSYELNNNDVERLQEQMLENKVCTEEEIYLAFYLDGTSIYTLLDVLTYKTDCETWADYCEENGITDVLAPEEDDEEDDDEE